MARFDVGIRRSGLVLDLSRFVLTLQHPFLGRLLLVEVKAHLIKLRLGGWVARERHEDGLGQS